jgi:hypothetical protein
VQVRVSPGPLGDVSVVVEELSEQICCHKANKMRSMQAIYE